MLCGKCGKRFASEANFRNHYTVEHTSKSQVCSICDKKFPNALTLDGHTNAHLMNAHSCNICGQFCTTRVELYVHVIVTHRFGGNFVCDICKKQFSRRRDLRKHLVQGHSNKIPAVESAAELLCTIHSSRSFPEDVTMCKYFKTEIDNHTEFMELRGADTRYDGPISETAGVTQAAITPVPKQVMAFSLHRNKNEIVGNSQPKTLMPPGQLDSQHPRLNNRVTRHSMTIDNKYSVNERNLQTQQDSFPQYPDFLSSVNPSIDGKCVVYVCEVCGMKFEDMNSFLKSHFSSDSYFGIA